MTINDFVRKLILEVEQILQDNYFQNIHGETVDIKGYPHELPIRSVQAGWEQTAESGEELFPYFLVQLDEIHYEDGEALATVWILFAVYDESTDMTGWKNLTNAVEKVVHRFRCNVALDYYYCERKMKVAYPEDGSWPHFFAGMEMTWHLPVLMPENLEGGEWNEQESI